MPYRQSNEIEFSIVMKALRAKFLLIWIFVDPANEAARVMHPDYLNKNETDWIKITPNAFPKLFSVGEG